MTKYRFYEDRKVAVWGAHLLFHRGRNDRTSARRNAAIAHGILYAAACDDAAIEIEESETLGELKTCETI